METVVQVLIDGSSNDLTFSYSLPKGLTAKEGARVRVYLRKREAIGTVVAVESVDPAKLRFALKPIIGIIGDQPFLTEGLIKLAHWISDFYLTPVESVLRAMLPKPSRGEKEAGKTAKTVVALCEESEEVLEGIPARSAKQRALLRHLWAQGDTLLAEVTGALGFTAANVKALKDKGLVGVEERRVNRDPYADIQYTQTANLELNPEQQVVMTQLEAAFAKCEAGELPKPILLNGVTGSGKTEVYLQAIQKTIEMGREAIVLVPEIALTPQTAERFKQRFAAIQSEVAILHSNLSEGERHDEWRKVLEKKARIVIGARSAIFSPVAKLGLIVVDEEHENSYKQDSAPRYQARDMAIVRAHMENCPVLLGSATPSLESWQNALSGRYELATMKQRVDDRKLPLIRVIDMRQETRKAGAGPTLLSDKLRSAIEDRLASGEQTILFLNRRGFARNILCPECGYVANCRHCSTTLTVHQKDDRLICHICGFAQLPPRVCPECSGKSIVNAGYGTERVEEVLKKVFEKARIVRVDTDAMRRKNQLRDTLAAFRAKKIDILLGTQMIAKGLHFPSVTLVGLINADVGLHIPDFRAGERTFQLLLQVAGRAGRGELEGEVIVQTYTPHHPAIQYGRHHDFEGFAEMELSMRRQFQHPPFANMALIMARGAHRERTELTLKTLHSRLARDMPPHVKMTDPLPAMLEKSHDQWRYQLVLKSQEERRLARHIRPVLETMTFPDDVLVTVDIDPYMMG